ncbi:(d)CMP kinase [Meiothermus ruber]|jgi:cytidylate kinase|uniref:Cytidylate kinase n=1 Tax=Meiothermus ruber (strain ATCC 35948 / DSM 1279 / VKM B-1258 / 21) TaxID=504728 RepID=D3PMT0_MEIRD|nr:(d)CMP kinase [Meiothermus ruber]ADD27255.1 cytidylate kinase [Meiothermus ruber DSM 1279]AGK03707.1 cytidylate kinase [Meiothermus ruber DSM 1279]MCL6530033.1 (d)CMP kinase [Meiothermus ruber]
MTEIITIDGPSASGKTSVAQRVAQHLGIPYISSGLLYRAVALMCLLENVSAEEVETRLAKHRLELQPTPTQNLVFLDGREVSKALHSLEVDQIVSAVAVRPAIREYVNQVLRQIPPPFVVDGRDMGSAVFPQARYKFYLTASPEVRAQRRVPERGAAFDTVLTEIIRRDEADKRQSDPARDAIILDTSHLDLDGVVQRVLEHIHPLS